MVRNWKTMYLGKEVLAAIFTITFYLTNEAMRPTFVLFKPEVMYP